jgi:DNA-directed RNA polymerase subunit RPC12/RpoP
MCRYGFKQYKQHYACFGCRKVFRKPPVYDWPKAQQPQEDETVEIKCPQCGEPMAAMGLDFKAPRQSDVKQWRKVELLYRNGFAYHSCGCNGPGYRPRTLSEVPAFIEENRFRSDSEILEERFRKRIAVD